MSLRNVRFEGFLRRFSWVAVLVVWASLGLSPGLSGMAVATPKVSDAPPLPHSKMIHLNAFDSWELQCHAFSGTPTRDHSFGGVLCRGGELVKLHLIRKLDVPLPSRCPRRRWRKRRRQRQERRSCDTMCVNERLWRTSAFDWKLASCTLAASFERGGFAYKAGDVVSFDRDGKFISARLSRTGNVRQADGLRQKDKSHRTLHSTPFERFRDKEKHLLFRVGPFQCYYVYGDLSLICSD